jgi:hypothetical protein
VEYEIAKIPPDIRARMTDTDWIGVEWIGRGMILQVVALIAGSWGLGFWFSERRWRRMKEQHPHLPIERMN